MTTAGRDPAGKTRSGCWHESRNWKTVQRAPRLLDVPPAAFDTMSLDHANALLVAWGHRLGGLHRCYTQEKR